MSYDKHDEPEDVVTRMVEVATAKGWTVKEVIIVKDFPDVRKECRLRGEVVPFSGGALIRSKVADQAHRLEAEENIKSELKAALSSPLSTMVDWLIKNAKVRYK